MLEIVLNNEKCPPVVIHRVPYMLVLGDKEEKENEVNVRKYGEQEVKNVTIETFIKKMVQQIKERSI
ncbi:His/Gly/Thr/Pro-type tRNA ligase C-terminal domain-containing protein [Peribacillus sp. Bi96]|uniref:His/Gly/Thr/Pro-type tRNA ligase C-terminal domain-containing protein n=1 Tax=Peribacillus sp. Bi96 TaxID=2884273 RepID=UPI001E4FA2A4|nr:His/Gly/Thr/Pro-type tRNA ligase C-terminal domain-containing protein [Peribacillus sp. Bi96]